MRVLVVGSPNWTNYNSVVRNLTVIIEDLKYVDDDNKNVVFVHTGKAGAENMTTEYIGKVERYLRQKGIRIKEELFIKRRSGEKVDRITGDYDMITSGIDAALVFIKDSDKRGNYCISILKSHDIPTTVIKE